MSSTCGRAVCILPPQHSLSLSCAPTYALPFPLPTPVPLIPLPAPLAPLPFPLPMLVPSRACSPCSPCSAPLPFPLPMYACPLLALCPCLRIINTYLFIYLLHSHLITK